MSCIQIFTDDKQFNQSKIVLTSYSKKFTTRQIEKEPTYDGMDISEIERLKNIFRLRWVQFSILIVFERHRIIRKRKD